jgi:hypothetical protein
MAEKRSGESKVKGNSFGASGFTLGIISVISFGLIGIITSIVGFIFCLIQQKKRPTKLGKAGLIINIAGFILSIVYIIFFAPMLAKYLQSLNTSFPAA